jgi:glucokinase
MTQPTCTIGVDVGGTNLRAALVTNGKLEAMLQAPTLARDGHAAVLARIAALVRDVLREGAQRQPALTEELLASAPLGVGLPGKLDPQRGVVEFLPNLPGNWVDVPAAAILAEALGRPVRLINDARAATLGEWAYGAGRGVDTMACFTLGTGIGGGVVVGGRLHISLNGTAGELGHQVIDPHGPPCGCGGRGCLEAFASGPAITALGIKAVLQGLTTSIGARVAYDLNHITPQVMADAALDGDRVAAEIFERVGEYLGIGVSNVIVALGPQRVVIAGGVARLGDLLLDPIRRTVRERVHLAPVEQVEILPAQLGGDAGLVGAAVWAGL